MSRLILLVSPNNDLLEEFYRKLSAMNFDVDLRKNLRIYEKNNKINNSIYIGTLESIDAVNGFETTDILRYISLLRTNNIFVYAVSFNEEVFLTEVLKLIVGNSNILIENDNLGIVLRGFEYMETPTRLFSCPASPGRG